MLLSAQDVTVTRLGIPVLEGVSLALAAGEVVILRGPNGIGKTTLLRSLSGLQPLAGGQLQVGEDAIVYAGHADGLKSTLTVRENLGFWAKVFQSAADLDRVLAAMNLASLTNRRAGELSAGQKRRLGLARLLVADRLVWLLDEPTVSLDTASTQLFAGVVAAHLARGGGVLAATHIDLGLTGARSIDLSAFRARPPGQGGAIGVFDEAFL